MIMVVKSPASQAGSPALKEEVRGGEKGESGERRGCDRSRRWSRRGKRDDLGER